MKTGIYENTEASRFFKFVVVSWILISSLFLLASWATCSSLSNQMFHRETAIAGILTRSQGQALNSDTIISAFISESTEKDAEAGAALLKRAGYSDRTRYIVLPFFPAYFLNVTSVAILFILLLFASFTLPARRMLQKIYNRVDAIASKAMSVAGGRYREKLDEYAEGSFARLARAFNDMSGSVETAFEKLAKERLFLRNLISDISHQLKTPLAALKMYNEILEQEDENLSPASADFIRQSREQIERMEWLVLSLLKMAKVEAGSLNLEKNRCSLNELLTDCVSGFRLMADEHGVQLQISQASPIFLECDVAWLSEAVGNVIKNCIENTPQGGHVQVIPEETPVSVRITVQDDGPGIHPEDLPYIFKRFYRGRGRKNTMGTGVGLSLAKQITEQSGGILSVKNLPSGGACFIFTFVKNVM